MKISDFSASEALMSLILIVYKPPEIGFAVHCTMGCNRKWDKNPNFQVLVLQHTKRSGAEIFVGLITTNDVYFWKVLALDLFLCSQTNLLKIAIFNCLEKVVFFSSNSRRGGGEANITSVQ